MARRRVRLPLPRQPLRPDGSVIAGPAPRPLPWFATSLAPDGLIEVDSAENVPPGSSLSVPAEKV